MGLAPAEEVVLQSHPSACSPEADGEEVSMENEKNDPLAEFGLDAIDLQWTMKDIAAKRTWLINQQHVETLVALGLAEMREGIPYLTIAGQNTVWD
jgi:hypothetical protein